MPEALTAVNARIISLLTTEAKCRKLIRVSRETSEEAFKGLKVSPNILARGSNAIWDIVLAPEQEVKQLIGNNLTITTLRLHGHLSVKKITVHGMPVDICEDRMEAFFS